MASFKRRKCRRGKPCGKSCIAKDLYCRDYATRKYEDPKLPLRAGILRRRADHLSHTVRTADWRHPVRLADLSGAERDIAEAVTLWSNGNVSALRDPRKFKKKDAKADIRGRMGNVTPTGRAYRRARRVMTDLSLAPNRVEKPVTRGLAMNAAVVDKIKPGDVFDMGAINSFSFDGHLSLGYAVREAGKKGGHVRVVMSIDPDNVKRGTDITNISQWAVEEEFVTGGMARVVSKRLDTSDKRLEGGVWRIELEQLPHG